MAASNGVVLQAKRMGSSAMTPVERSDEMSDKELEELQDPETWDEGEVRSAVKSSRAVVSVSFGRDDLEQVSEFARRNNMKTSEFIRQAALSAARLPRSESPTIVVSGRVFTSYRAASTPRPKVDLNISVPGTKAFTTA
jgi:hypothetical protein